METQSNKKLVYGMMIAFGLHLIIFGILFLIGMMMSGYSFLYVFVVPGLLIAFTQIIYLLPTILILKAKEEFDLMKGVIIAGVITALLNGGCWLMVGVGSW